MLNPKELSGAISLVELAALPVAMGAAFFIGVQIAINYPIYEILSVQDFAIHASRTLPLLGLLGVGMAGLRFLVPNYTFDPNFYIENQGFFRPYIAVANTLFVMATVAVLTIAIGYDAEISDFGRATTRTGYIALAMMVAVMNYDIGQRKIVPFIYFVLCVISVFEGSTTVRRTNLNPEGTELQRRDQLMPDQVCVEKCYRVSIMMITSSYILAEDVNGTLVFARDKVVSYRRGSTRPKNG